MKEVDVFSQRRVYNWFINYLAIGSICIEREGVWKKYYALLTLFSVFGIFVLFYSLLMLINDIDSVAVLMHHAMILVDLIVANQLFFYRRKTVRELVKGAARSFDYESKLVSKFLDDLQKKREKSMTTAFKCIMFTAAFMQINLIIFGIVEKYIKNLDFVLLFPCWFPFDLSYIPYYILAFTWQHIFVQSLILTICGTMAVTYIAHIHLTSQINLLKFAIDKLKARAYEMASSTSKENEIFEDRLKKSYIKGTIQCVQHYSMIINYYSKAENMFRIIYFMVFLTGLIALTSTGFALISENTSLKIKFMGINVIQMGYLYVFCWFAENTSNLGESIRINIYASEWYEMPKECQSSLKLMIERTLKPFDFHTVTGQKVDLDNYMAMVKASYSYFNMMLATQQK